jgi:hypothetical protein
MAGRVILGSCSDGKYPFKGEGGMPMIFDLRTPWAAGSCERFSYLSRGRLSWEYASKENL